VGGHAERLNAAVGIGRARLVVVFACAVAWDEHLSPPDCRCNAADEVERSAFQQLVALLFVLGVAIVGVLTVARWAAGQLKTNADMGSQSESASLPAAGI
jgi:hypothetical protein